MTNFRIVELIGDKFHVNKHLINSILTKINEKQCDEIAIISVVGPHFEGNTFAINLILNCLERGDQANGQAKNPGIEMWDKPFIKEQDGKKVAILLVNLQNYQYQFEDLIKNTSLMQMFRQPDSWTKISLNAQAISDDNAQTDDEKTKLIETNLDYTATDHDNSFGMLSEFNKETDVSDQDQIDTNTLSGQITNNTPEPNKPVPNGHQSDPSQKAPDDSDLTLKAPDNKVAESPQNNQISDEDSETGAEPTDIYTKEELDEYLATLITKYKQGVFDIIDKTESDITKALDMGHKSVKTKVMDEFNTVLKEGNDTKLVQECRQSLDRDMDLEKTNFEAICDKRVNIGDQLMAELGDKYSDLFRQEIDQIMADKTFKYMEFRKICADFEANCGQLCQRDEYLINDEHLYSYLLEKSAILDSFQGDYYLVKKYDELTKHNIKLYKDNILEINDKNIKIVLKCTETAHNLYTTEMSKLLRSGTFTGEILLQKHNAMYDTVWTGITRKISLTTFKPNVILKCQADVKNKLAQLYVDYSRVNSDNHKFIKNTMNEITLKLYKEYCVRFRDKLAKCMHLTDDQFEQAHENVLGQLWPVQEQLIKNSFTEQNKGFDDKYVSEMVDKNRLYITDNIVCRKQKYKHINNDKKDKSHSLVVQFNDKPTGAYFNRQKGGAENVPDPFGDSAVNCIAFNGNRILYGCNAELYLNGNAYDIKDIMGRDVSTNEDLTKYRLNVVQKNPVKVRLVFTDTTQASVDLNVESLFALQVLDMKSRAETEFKNYMQNVLFIVPTSYTIRQIQAVKDSAKIAGIEHAYILSQMSAASIKYIAYKCGATNGDDSVIKKKFSNWVSKLFDKRKKVFDCLITGDQSIITKFDFVPSLKKYCSKITINDDSLITRGAVLYSNHYENNGKLIPITGVVLRDVMCHMEFNDGKHVAVAHLLRRNELASTNTYTKFKLTDDIKFPIRLLITEGPECVVKRQQIDHYQTRISMDVTTGETDVQKYNQISTNIRRDIMNAFNREFSNKQPVNLIKTYGTILGQLMDNEDTKCKAIINELVNKNSKKYKNLIENCVKEFNDSMNAAIDQDINANGLDNHYNMLFTRINNDTINAFNEKSKYLSQFHRQKYRSELTTNMTTCADKYRFLYECNDKYREVCRRKISVDSDSCHAKIDTIYHDTLANYKAKVSRLFTLSNDITRDMHIQFCHSVKKGMSGGFIKTDSLQKTLEYEMGVTMAAQKSRITALKQDWDDGLVEAIVEKKAVKLKFKLYTQIYQYKLQNFLKVTDTNYLGICLARDFLIGTYFNGKVQYVPDTNGENYVDNSIAYKNSFIFGAEARGYLADTCGSFDIKDLLWKDWADEAELMRYPFRDWLKNPLRYNLKPQIDQDTVHRLNVETMVALQALHIKHSAETLMKHAVRMAVFTIRTDYRIRQRAILRDVAKIAGFDKTYLITEITAAGIAYIIDNPMDSKAKEIIMVFALDHDQCAHGVIKVSNSTMEYLSYGIQSVENLLEVRTHGTGSSYPIIRDFIINQLSLSDTYLSKILVVGHSARLPEFQRHITAHFEPRSVLYDCHPRDVIARGTAYYGQMLEKRLDAIDIREVIKMPIKMMLYMNNKSETHELMDQNVSVFDYRQKREVVTNVSAANFPIEVAILEAGEEIKSYRIESPPLPTWGRPIDKLGDTFLPWNTLHVGYHMDQDTLDIHFSATLKARYGNDYPITLKDNKCRLTQEDIEGQRSILNELGMFKTAPVETLNTDSKPIPGTSTGQVLHPGKSVPKPPVEINRRAAPVDEFSAFCAGIRERLDANSDVHRIKKSKLLDKLTTFIPTGPHLHVMDSYYNFEQRWKEVEAKLRSELSYEKVSKLIDVPGDDIPERCQLRWTDEKVTELEADVEGLATDGKEGRLTNMNSRCDKLRLDLQAVGDLNDPDEVPDSDKCQYVLNRLGLDDILVKVGDRRVALVFGVSKQGEGNSFLMNKVGRHIVNSKKYGVAPDGDDMEIIADPTEPLF
ncbi:unnamed protein product, partial [Oppiella nova]